MMMMMFLSVAAADDPGDDTPGDNNASQYATMINAAIKALLDALGLSGGDDNQGGGDEPAPAPTTDAPSPGRQT